MIGETLQRTLRLEGYAVDWVRDASAADGTLASERFDLVLLDLGLPRGAAPGGPADGLALLQGLRARHDATPVIVLTARDARGDRVAGLDAGADDYLVKPFEFDELNARIRAVLRRAAGAEPVAGPIEVGELVVDAATRQASLGGEALDLSRKEFDLLLLLALRSGEVVSRREILSEVWQQAYGGGDRTLDVHLSWLRRKLGETAAHPVYLRSVRGVGLRLAAPDRQP